MSTDVLVSQNTILFMSRGPRCEPVLWPVSFTALKSMSNGTHDGGVEDFVFCEHHSEAIMDIFVEDDERLIAETLAIILRQRGYTVQGFHCPTIALEHQHLQPRLVLSDYRMPVLTGTELLWYLWKAVPDCVAIVFSADLDEDDLEWKSFSEEFPGIKLLRKPIHPAQLLQCVSALIGDPPAERGSQMQLSTSS